MAWWDLPRIPEPEIMNAEGDVSAYAAAATEPYLDALDNAWVDKILDLGILAGSALDVGTGPGSIPLKLARRNPNLRLVGVDRSPVMIREARRAAADENLTDRVCFLVGSAHRTCFPDDCFDLVVSNSLLHHLRDPVGVFREMERVARPGGLVVFRDLRRPSAFSYPWHLQWYGRRYTGRMKQLYADSIHAAYTDRELSGLLEQASLDKARVLAFDRTHLGFLFRKD